MPFKSTVRLLVGVPLAWISHGRTGALGALSWVWAQEMQRAEGTPETNPDSGRARPCDSIAQTEVVGHVIRVLQVAKLSKLLYSTSSTRGG